jgi:hypothetical protein
MLRRGLGLPDKPVPKRSQEFVADPFLLQRKARWSACGHLLQMMQLSDTDSASSCTVMPWANGD